MVTKTAEQWRPHEAALESNDATALQLHFGDTMRSTFKE